MLHPRPESGPPAFERYHPIVESPVLMADGTTVPAIQLADRFYDSEYGQAMPDQPLRYVGRFGYDREDMRTDLGHDLCPVGHQMELPYHTGRLLDEERRSATKYGNLPDQMIGILILTELVHDSGESMHPRLLELLGEVVGDIPAGLKTDHHRRVEAAVRAFIFAELYPDVHPDVLLQMEAIISHQDDGVLHDIFEASHAIQTVETSNYAQRRLLDDYAWFEADDLMRIETDDIERLSGLLGISREPLYTSLPSLERFSYLSLVRRVKDDALEIRGFSRTV